MKLSILLLSLFVIAMVFAPLSANACYYGCGTWGAPHYGYNYAYHYQYGYNTTWANQRYGHWRRWMPVRQWGYTHAGYWPYGYAYSYSYTY